MEDSYENDHQILSFAGSGNIWLCDDYRYRLMIENSIYPTLRHAVLSFKTDDELVKQEIALTLLPADLKDLERKIRPVRHWTGEFILERMEFFTSQKFEFPDFRKKLLNTDPKELINGLMNGQQRFDIDEICNDENVYGKMLMKEREKIKTQVHKLS